MPIFILGKKFSYLVWLQHNNLLKVREGRYHSKIKALETLAIGAAEESEVILSGTTLGCQWCSLVLDIQVTLLLFDFFARLF